MNIESKLFGRIEINRIFYKLEPKIIKSNNSVDPNQVKQVSMSKIGSTKTFHKLTLEQMHYQNMFFSSILGSSKDFGFRALDP